jgi:hypothetical protein
LPRKLPGIYWFFNETRQFFEGLEIPGTSGSLILILFKFPELAVITKIKDPLHTGFYLLPMS